VKLRSLFSTRKRIAAVAGAGALVLGAAGMAAAYFSGSGTGSYYAGAGTLSAFTVTGYFTHASAFPSYTTPGKGPTSGGPTNASTYFYVQNASGKKQLVLSDSASVVANGSGWIETATDGTASVTGCYASWFEATPYAFATKTGAPVTFVGSTITNGKRDTAYVVLHMPYNTTTENACQGRTPKITFTVKGANI
jgi:hypothetical protein